MRLFLLSLLAAMLLQGCAQDRFYAISRATPDDAALARRILREVAVEAGLPGDTGRKESLGDYGISNAFGNDNVSLHGRLRGDRINVWLSRTEWPPPQAFHKADQLLAPAFSRAFGRRFAVSEISDIDEITMF